MFAIYQNNIYSTQDILRTRYYCAKMRYCQKTGEYQGNLKVKSISGQT